MSVLLREFQFLLLVEVRGNRLLELVFAFLAAFRPSDNDTAVLRSLLVQERSAS